MKPELSPLEFLTISHNGKLRRKNKLCILVIVPWQTYMEGSEKEVVQEFVLRRPAYTQESFAFCGHWC